METRIDKYLQSFALESIENTHITDAHIQELLDQIRNAYEIDCVYVMQNMNAKYSFQFTHMSVSKEKYDAKGHCFTMTDQDYQTSLKYSVADELGAHEQEISTPHGPSTVLKVSYLNGTNYHGSIGFQSFEEKEWSQEEKEAVIKLSRVLRPFVYREQLSFKATYENSIDELGLTLFWYYPQLKTMCVAEKSQKKFHLDAKYENMPESFVTAFVDEAYQEDFRAMYQQIENGARSANCIYKFKGLDLWFHVHLSATQWDENGTIGECIGFVEDISATLLREQVQQEMEEAKAAEHKANKNLLLHMQIETTLSNVYYCIYYMDLHTDSYIWVSGADRVRKYIPDEGILSENLAKATELFSSKEYLDMLRKFNDLTTLKERMRNQDTISCDYHAATMGWCRSVFVAMDRDTNGDVCHVLYTIQVIDEERRRELDLQEKERKIHELETMQLQTISDAIPGGFKISNCDEDYSLHYISPELVQMLGYDSAEELMEVSNGNMNNLCYQEDAAPPKPIFHKDYSGREIYDLKYRIRCKNGSYKWIQDRGQKVYNTEGKPQLYSMVLDINEAEEQRIALDNANAVVAQERRKYRDALTRNALFYYDFDVTLDILDGKAGFVCDEQFYLEPEPIFPCTYTAFSKKCVSYFGISLLKKSDETLVTRQGMLNAFENGETQIEIETYFEKLDMYVRLSHLLSLNPIDGHVNAFVVASDQTEVRKDEILAKQRLEDAYTTAKRANMAKSDFLSKMSHDIRTPMNAIIGMTAIAGASLDDPKTVEDALNNISSASRHLLGLINEVLDMSKIESGKLTLNQEDFSIKDLFHNLLIMVQPQIEQHQHTLHVDVEHIQHTHVIGDSLRLQQVFVNLTSNAVKYTPNGGLIQITAKEKATTQPNMACFECTFEDNGMGMTPEYLEHIFEPFTREEDTRTNKIQGTGLGMAIAKSIIELMNGDIKVESELGKGSKFTVTLYLTLQEHVQEKAVETSTKENALEIFRHLDYSDKRILMAEDMPMNIAVAKKILDMTNVQLEIANNGKIALDMFLEHEPGYYDLILMDVQMPVMNGYEATSAIRSNPRPDTQTIPIVAMTANAFAEDIQAARNAGMNSHIAKPFDFKHLADVLQTYLQD